VWHITVNYAFDADGGLVHSYVTLSERLFTPATHAASFHTMDPFLALQCVHHRSRVITSINVAFVCSVALAVVSAWMCLLSIKELYRGWKLYKVCEEIKSIDKYDFY